jgi:hypothetical protein
MQYPAVTSSDRFLSEAALPTGSGDLFSNLLAAEASGPVNGISANATALVAGKPRGEHKHGYNGGLMGHSEITYSTIVSADVTVGPVTFYGGLLHPFGHSAENFYTVSTTKAPEFLLAVANKLKSMGNVGAAEVLFKRIKDAQNILEKGIQPNAKSAQRGGPNHSGGHTHGQIGLDMGIYLYGPTGNEGKGAKVLMQAFADWTQGKPINLKGLDDVGFGMYATPTAALHRGVGRIFQVGVHGLWGAFAGFTFEDNRMKREFLPSERSRRALASDLYSSVPAGCISVASMRRRIRITRRIPST